MGILWLAAGLGMGLTHISYMLVIQPVTTMSSRKGSGNRINPEVSSAGVDELSRGVADLNLTPTNDGDWEVYARKSRNRGGGKPWGSGASNPNMRPATTHDPMRPVGGRGPQSVTSFRSAQSNRGPAPAVSAPLQHGWNWHSGRAASVQATEVNVDEGAENEAEDEDADKDNDEDDQDNDDELLSDDFDSDESDKSHETRKNSRWFKKFFEDLDGLTIEQINDPSRQWHCPACHGGPGAIDWYRGLQPLVTHAKTKGSQRVKLHREFAELLDEELRRRGTSVVPAGEAFGKWAGLTDDVQDKEIVWPPMVVVMNTRLDKDDNDKWTGMGNQELLDYFNSYRVAKAKHAYGPQGHRGMSILIFEASPVGYLEAVRLSKHFESERTDRDAWERCKLPVYSGGKRKLYGFMAEKRDLDSFNQHCQGKSKQRFEMRSHQEMVVNQLKQMSEENQQLIWMKNKVAKEQKRSQALEESIDLLSQKLRQQEEESRIVKLRMKIHHEQNKEEMDSQDQFYKDRVKEIYDAREAKEDGFEEIQQKEREKVKQSQANSSSAEDRRRRTEEFIKFQDREIENFVEERERLIRMHDEKIAAMKRRHHEEEVELENMFDAELNKLMEKYTPK